MFVMRILIVFMVGFFGFHLSLMLFGVGGFDKEACQQNAENSVSGQVENVPGSSYRFIGVDDETGTVYYVETMNIMNCDVTQKDPLIVLDKGEKL